MVKKSILCLVVILMVGLLAAGCADEAEVTRMEDLPEEIEEEMVGEEEVEGEPETEEDEPLHDNSRTNPADLNETFVVEKDDLIVGKVTYEVELIQTVSGQEAWEIVKEGNPFNEEPEEGKEYVLAKFRVKVLETEEDEPFNVNHAQFEAVSEGGVTYDDFISVSGVEPDLRGDLYEGAEKNGYTYFIVDKDDNPVAALNRGRSGEIWFDLRAGD